MQYLIFGTLILILSCSNRKNETEKISTNFDYFNAISKNDIKLDAPKKGEWLFEHKEKGQTFEEYKRLNPIRPTPDKHVIYLMPIGDFTVGEQKVLDLTRDYLEIFFQQKTILLKETSDKIIPTYGTRLKENNLQLLAPYILDTLLKSKNPNDGIALMAITAKDLYPANDWNFVFGLASYRERLGVSSIYRLQNKVPDSTNLKVFLKRLINISSHEIGHMMSLYHCTFAKCVMNGSNSLHETDFSPNRLCSECQKKLFWNIKYDNEKRLNQLMEFCRITDLKSDFGVLNLDKAALE